MAPQGMQFDRFFCVQGDHFTKYAVLIILCATSAAASASDVSLPDGRPAVAPEAVSDSTNRSLPVFTWDEVRAHRSRHDIWVVIGSGVYDLSGFLERHGGGVAPMLLAGQDATAVWHSIHSPDILESYKYLLIGRIRGRQGTGVEGTASGTSNGGFQDHMANEGETSSIPQIILILYGSIVALSFLAVKWMTVPWYATPAVYFIGLLLFYAWHQLSHRPWTGQMFTDHVTHHLVHYPPHHFYGISDDMVTLDTGLSRPGFLYLLDIRHSLTSDWSGFTRIVAPLFIAGMIGSSIIHLCTRRNLKFTVLVIVIWAFMAMALNALHMSYHVRDFEFEKWQWYRELRTLHFIHHLGDLNHNYAMLNHGIDALFGSLCLNAPLGHLRKPGSLGLILIVFIPLAFIFNLPLLLVQVEDSRWARVKAADIDGDADDESAALKALI